MAHTRHKVLDALVSVCKSVSVGSGTLHVFLRTLNANEIAAASRPYLLIQPLTGKAKSTLGVEGYYKLLIRLKLSMARDDDGTKLSDIIESLEDKLRQNYQLGGACDFIRLEDIDPFINGTNTDASIYICAYYRRVH